MPSVFTELQGDVTAGVYVQEHAAEARSRCYQGSCLVLSTFESVQSRVRIEHGERMWNKGL